MLVSYKSNTTTQQESQPTPALSPRGPLNRLWLLACVLLALVQVQWAGYQLGVGNQSIQVAFLQRLHDPTLFARDEMVNQTLARYPSLFYGAVAQLLGVVEFQHLYLVLHLLTAIGLFIAAAALARGMFGSHWAGLVLGLFLLAGHHHALAEQTLYSSGFTHTWAVFPVMIAVLALWYADRPWWAFALTGALANAHALEAGQLGLALAFWAVCRGRQLGWRKVAGLLAVMGALALPAAVMMLRNHQSFDAGWFELMRVRSALHSFPSAWWRAGNPDVPRFALVLALAALAVTLNPARRNLGKTLLLAIAVAVMFVAGYLFTETWPSSTAIRAQLFRSSRFLMIVLLAYIAWGCARSWRLAWLPGERWRGWLEAGSATLTAVALIVEPALVLLPVALVIGSLVALLNRRLLWQQALVVAVALLVTLLAWRQIQFVVPGLSPEFSWASVVSWAGPGTAAWLLLLAIFATWFLSARQLAAGQSAVVAVVAGGTIIWLAAVIGPALLRPKQTDAAWFDVQAWAKSHTAADALFLTPAQTGGFRILSGRSVVAEWRDGTQLYFSAGFTKPWWERMNALQPGMRLAPDKRRLLVRGKHIGQLDDEALLALARQYGATHIVLPADEPRRLVGLYTNTEWTVYRPQIEVTTAPAEALLAKQARFIETVALPAIEKNRKSDVRLQITGLDGRPVYDASYRLAQVSTPFRFGISVPVEMLSDTNAAARLRDVFNFTVLRDVSRWDQMERAPEVRQTDAAGKALEEYRARGMTVEWSSLAGWAPRWFEGLDLTNRSPRVLAHASDLLGRFAGQVEYWQLTDQDMLLDPATNIIGVLRVRFPGLKIGWSDAGRFWSPYDGVRRQSDLLRGLDEARRIGADFISLHGQLPWGTWAEARAIYEVFDACHKEGLPVHVTQFSVPADGAIEGPVRRGEWDAKLQAEYCRQFYTVAFSHPNVAALNYADASLLHSRPAYNAVRELITKQWRTRLKGKLPLDGRIAFRGFHGDYELVVTLKNGQTARATFNVPATALTSQRFVCDPAAGKLEVVK
jgi:hypothetical protein